MDARDDFVKVETEKANPRKLHSCVMRSSFGARASFSHDRIITETCAANGVYKLRGVIIPSPIYRATYVSSFFVVVADRLHPV